MSFANIDATMGHIQFASVPDRLEPDVGDVNYADIFISTLDVLGYNAPLGAEYNLQTTTTEGLGWLQTFFKS